MIIEEYIEKTREERRSHLKLDQSCIEIGGNSTSFKGLLAHTLGTTIPNGHKIYLCHACNNERCSNPNHLYWGTPTDNLIDRKENGTHTSVNVLTKRKYGEKYVEEHGRWLGKNHGGSNRYTIDQIKYFQTVCNSFEKKWGWKTKAANVLKISHTQFRRLYEKYAPSD